MLRLLLLNVVIATSYSMCACWHDWWTQSISVSIATFRCSGICGEMHPLFGVQSARAVAGWTKSCLRQSVGGSAPSAPTPSRTAPSAAASTAALPAKSSKRYGARSLPDRPRPRTSAEETWCNAPRKCALHARCPSRRTVGATLWIAPIAGDISAGVVAGS